MISDDPAAIEDAAGVVLPGVGAFKDCYDGLCDRGFTQPILDYAKSGRPLLGICVGMQLLFEAGEEGEGSPGLGLLRGRVVRFPDAAETGLKVPHMGWNNLKQRTERPCPLLKHCPPSPYVYSGHSYRPGPADDEDVYATAEYGVEFAAVVGRDNLFGVQFHPEKSQDEGIALLRAFGEFVTQAVRSATL